MKTDPTPNELPQWFDEQAMRLFEADAENKLIMLSGAIFDLHGMAMEENGTNQAIEHITALLRRVHMLGERHLGRETAWVLLK